MKTLDAESLHQGVENTSAAIKGIRSHTNDLRLSIENFISSEASFNGQGGKAVRSFYQECHLPFLSYMENVITHFEEKLVNLTSSLKSFEPQESGFVREDFLTNDVSNGLQKAQNVTEQLTSESNSIIKNVNDIIYIPELQQNDFNATIHRGQKKTTEVLEDLHSLDKSQANNLDTFLQECQTLMNYITEVSTKFQSGDISVSGYKVGTMSAIPAYKTVMSNLSSDSIGTSTVGKAVQAKKSNNVRFDPMAPYKGPSGAYRIATDGVAFYSAGREVNGGFKVSKFGKRENAKYRVYESKYNKFSTPPKNGRNYKIHSKKYIESQVNRGNSLNLNASKFLNGKAGAISAVKSKIGWLGVGITTFDNVRKNIQNDGSTSKIIGDAAVDVAIGAATLAAGGAFAALAVSAGAPVLIGTGVTIVASLTVSYVFDGLKINNKSIGDHVKKGVQSVAGWFSDTAESIFD
ncbi:LXG domain-containing protein [Pseudalkalibacillus hwajinpoensis]|nr:LXG domain-containing protein [Pseudalkalibacillus hwajinpoensis]